MTTTYWATTTAINCSGYSGVTLDFWRWLGVEQSPRDHAYVQVSNDGTNWTTVWANPTSNLVETAWSNPEYNISAVADNQPTVYIRWGMGPTNSSKTYCGWNIDDVTLWGTPTDTTPPSVSSVTPTPATVADANVGTAAFALTVTFNEAMNTAVAPTISFPVENPAGTLTFDGPLSGWSNNTTYVARYDVADSNVELQNVAVRVTGAKDAAGNTQNQADFTNVFSIDTVNPTVTIDQAAGQADPTNASPINFTVVFNEAMSEFVTGDVTLSGTAGATTAIVTNPIGDQETYNVAVSGMTGNGTVVASIAAGVAHDAAGNPNTASTSTDNTVTYDVTPPTAELVAVSPATRTTPVADISIVFSEPITGLSLADLQLTCNGGANLLTGSETLTTSDDISWTLGNLTGDTQTAGTYVLTLGAAGSGIVDAAGNARSP